MKVCIILSISGGNDSRKIQERRLIFKLGSTHVMDQRTSLFYLTPDRLGVFCMFFIYLGQIKTAGAPFSLVLSLLCRIHIFCSPGVSGDFRQSRLANRR